MAVQAHGDVLGRQWRLSLDRDFNPGTISVSARRLCGRKAQKSVEECFTIIRYDLRTRLSCSLERGSPQLTRTALNEEESPVGYSVRASSKLPQEFRYGSPRRGFLCGKEMWIVSACRKGDIKDRFHSHVGIRRSQRYSIVQETNRLPPDSVPTSGARDLKRYSLQVGRGGGTLHLPSVSTTSEAIALLKNHQQQGIIITSHTFTEVLKRCWKQKDIVGARQVHDCIIQSGMDKNPYVVTSLLSVYIKCGRLRDARRVFDGLEKKTSITWNAMIAGYAQNDLVKDALEVFNRMRQAGVKPEKSTYLSILKVCTSPLALKWGKQVHTHITSSGLESDVRIGTALVQMFAKCGCITEARRVFENLAVRDVISSSVMMDAYATSGSIDDARQIFDGMPKRDIVTWNIMIGAYAKCGFGMEAYQLFLQMREEGFVPNAVTYISILNASASAGALDWVKEVHSHALRAGMGSELRVGNVFVHMFAKSGSIDDARLVFERMEKRDVVTWTTMIGAYAERGRGLEAYQCFLQMKREGFIPNVTTYVSILNASASAGALDWVKEVHSHALEDALESDLRVGSVLVCMYAKSGSIDDARLVFDRMEKRDVITWTIMIGAYAERGCGVEAYRLFLRMKQEGFIPNANTYVSILNANASAGALDWVKEVHGHALEAGLELDLLVGNALVHMYAKSGSIDDARLVFHRMEKRDSVTWTAMIRGLAQHGCGSEALELFRQMNADCVKPDGTTFVAVLSACCHAGLVDDGRRLFFAMTQDYGIEPTIVHCNCMVDILGRAGQLEEAKLFIGDMPVEPDSVTWGTLLGACRTYGNVELGEFAFEELLKLEPKNATAYVVLSNLYAAASKWEKVSSVRTMMQERGVRKEPGRSWIEVDYKIHDFFVGDSSHPEAKAIYTELNQLMEKLKAEGYIANTQLVLQNIDEEDKALALCSHSEKLAIVYGIMHIPPEKPIRVFKNLRVCSDCHTATKLISKVTGREIIARDSARFHHFKNGVCSCGDYW